MTTNMPMPTAAPEPSAAGYPPSRTSGLYTGPGGMKALAATLSMLIREGRELAQPQRQRWMENRAFYRGDQWLQYHPASAAMRLAPTDTGVRGARRRDTINRLRPFVDARLALYAVERPPFEVIPPDSSQQAVDGAHQAEKFLSAQWGANGWNIKGRIPELALAGEIDGVAFLCVEWDSTKGPESNIPFVVTEQGPVTDPADVAALKEQDPHGGTLWREVTPSTPMGDVNFRVVRAGAMSVDPLCGSQFEDAYWCCESRVISKAQAQEIAGKSWTDIMRTSDGVMGITDRDYGAVGMGVDVDTGDVVSTQRRRDAVTVHMFYHRPGGDFPRGLRCIWFEQAPGDPAVLTEWNDDLPYRAFTPRPDGGNVFSCRGTVDDLKPIQRRFNRVLSLLHEWLDRVARPPIGIYRGSLASNDIYNERGFFELNPGFGEPSYMTAPTEPVAVLTQNLGWMVGEMAQVASITDAVRGEVSGTREAASSIQLRIQQTEQQLAGSTAELVGIYEWGCSRALQLVARNYILPRAVVAPGSADSLEFQAFVGEMLGGAYRFKVVGSIQPATRAAEMQGLLQFAPIIGDAIRPWVSSLISGDTTDFKRADEAQRKRQQRKNRMLAALGANETAQQVFTGFEELRRKYAEALQTAATQLANQPPPPASVGPDGMPVPGPPPMSPQSVLEARGITPPRLLDMLSQANIPVPVVEVQDDPIQQLAILRLWMVSEGFERMHPMVHQCARELTDALTGKMTEQLQAMGQQDPNAPSPENPDGGGSQGGSQPAPKGQPSQPKQPGQPAGTPPARMPTGG